MLDSGSGEALIASREPALTEWESRAVPPPTTAATAPLRESRLPGQEDADDGAGRGPDDRGDRVPGRVDVGDLVGDELHRVEEAGHRQHVPASEHVGDLRGVVQVVGDAEHEHDEIAVQAARPAAGEDQREWVHARESRESGERALLAGERGLSRRRWAWPRSSRPARRTSWRRRRRGGPRRPRSRRTAGARRRSRSARGRGGRAGRRRR